MQNQKTAILFFSRSAEAESRFKRFSPKSGKNRLLMRQFILRTESTLKKSSLPYFVFDEKNQKGKDFGERFANAFQTLFNLGFERVISVGNDAPGLRLKHIEQAQNQLNQSSFVIGKDKRGGAYLIGIQKKSFDFESFKNLNWQSTNLIESFQNTFGTQKISWLESLEDINKLTELERLYFKLSVHSKLKHLIHSILVQPIQMLPSSIDILWYNPELQNHGLRAPPIS